MDNNPFTDSQGIYEFPSLQYIGKKSASQCTYRSSPIMIKIESDQVVGHPSTKKLFTDFSAVVSWKTFCCPNIHSIFFKGDLSPPQIWLDRPLKGQWNEIFKCWFYHQTATPGTMRGTVHSEWYTAMPPFRGISETAVYLTPQRIGHQGVSDTVEYLTPWCI